MHWWATLDTSAACSALQGIKHSSVMGRPEEWGGANGPLTLLAMGLHGVSRDRDILTHAQPTQRTCLLRALSVTFCYRCWMLSGKGCRIQLRIGSLPLTSNRQLTRWGLVTGECDVEFWVRGQGEGPADAFRELKISLHRS